MSLSPNIRIPNSFTPNEDNHNETFYVHGADKDDIESDKVIFNRWGEKIYETPGNEPWDGKNCPVGIYTLTQLELTINTTQDKLI